MDTSPIINADNACKPACDDNLPDIGDRLQRIKGCVLTAYLMAQQTNNHRLRLQALDALACIGSLRR
jgi:hypothetical protein